MAEESKEKLVLSRRGPQRIEELKRKVGEWPTYIKIDERRQELAALEEQQARRFLEQPCEGQGVIAATKRGARYVVPFTSLTKTVEDAGVMLEPPSGGGPPQQTASGHLAELQGRRSLATPSAVVLGGKFEQYNVS